MARRGLTQKSRQSLERMARQIEALARVGGAENVSGMRVAGEEIATDVRASRPGAGIPRDEGVLAASITVTGPAADNVVRITAGGAAAPYALRQHEDMTFRHRLGEARYLIRALERWVRGGRPIDALRAQATAAMEAARRTR
jgi:hypothetical protein